MTVIVTRNSDGSVTLTVGGWVGPDPERLHDEITKLVQSEWFFNGDGPKLVDKLVRFVAAAYPVGPVLTLTAEDWAEVESVAHLGGALGAAVNDPTTEETRHA